MLKLKASPLVITLVKASRALAVDTRTFIPLLLCAMVLLNGCFLPIPTGERKVLWGEQPVTQEQMAFLTPNVTTKKEVIDRLGSPTWEVDRLGSPGVNWEDARVFVYKWVMQWGFLFWAVGGYYVGGGGIDDIPKEYLLLIQFDEQDRVRRFEKVWFFYGCKSYGDFIKKWVGNSETSPPSGGDRKE